MEVEGGGGGADAEVEVVEVEVEVWELCIRRVHMITKGASVDITTHVHVWLPWVSDLQLDHIKVSV